MTTAVVADRIRRWRAAGDRSTIAGAMTGNHPRVCPSCQAELVEGAPNECGDCGWRRPTTKEAVAARVVGDFAFTPEGEPNLTREQFVQQDRAQQRFEFEHARDRAAAVGTDVRRFDTGGGDVHEAMSQLSLCFHALRQMFEQGELQGVRPWDPVALRESACRCLHDTGSLQAAAFVLHVWNPDDAWSMTAAERALANREGANRSEDPCG